MHNFNLSRHAAAQDEKLALVRGVHVASATEARVRRKALKEFQIRVAVAKVVRHGHYVTFQMAEVAIPRSLFAEILRRIDRLRPRPTPA